jgi:hypothetical protein
MSKEISRREFLRGAGAILAVWAAKEFVTDGWRRSEYVDLQITPKIVKLTDSRSEEDKEQLETLHVEVSKQTSIASTEGITGVCLGFAGARVLFQAIRNK